jgi:DNA polymerase-3 subunit beta
VNKLQGKGNPITLKFKEEDYESLANHTSFAVAKDESRPVFTGVGIKAKNGEVFAYASNMHKLAHIKVVADVSDNLDMIKILPKEVFGLKPEGDVTMVIYDNAVSISYGSFNFSFPLIEGTAPNYDAVIPTTNVEMTVSKADFLGEIQKALLASVGKDMNPIQIYFRSDKIEVYSECNEFGKIHGAMRVSVPAILQNKRIAFNGEYLGELKHFNTDTFTLATVVNGDSIELSPVKFYNEEEDYTFVVTPVRMKSWSLDEK